MKRKSAIVRWVLPLLGIAVMSAIILLTTAAIRQNVWNALEQPLSGLPSIVSYKSLDTEISTLGTAVSKVEAGVNATGETVAYRLETFVTGFNSEVPIQLAVTISADGNAVRGIEVLSHKETEYYGSRIKDASFKERFVDRNLPLYLTGESGRGAHVDGLSGATISSKAVVNAVNTAADFVRTYIIKGE